MSTTTKNVIRMKFTLNNGKESTLTINAEPINETLVDPDTSDPLLPSAMSAIAAAYETDEGATIQSYSVDIVTTTTTNIAQDQVPT